MAEMAAVFILIMACIWLSETSIVLSGICAVLIFVVMAWSWRKNKDNGRTLGFCPPDLRLFRIIFLWSLPALAVMGVIGHCISPRFWEADYFWEKLYRQALGPYLFGSIIQEVMTHGYFTNRLGNIFRSHWKIAVTVGLLFAAAHLPNPVLMVVTLVWGTIGAYLFIHYSRNVYALGLCHAAMGAVIKYLIAFPLLGHGCMRVGPGYFN